MTTRPLRQIVPIVAVLVATPAGASVSPVSSASAQTLCILDFQRAGDDGRSDWLEQGLADLMIGTMGSLSPYLVVERRHLKEILREHGLADGGFVDVGTAVRRARLVKAQLLLQGSFARHGDRLTIQVRLIRVSDQHVLSVATWTDAFRDLLTAPRTLSERLLRDAGRSLDADKVAGLETLFPTTIDAAASYYEGLRAFDDGRYPDALAHYLDSARIGDGFRKADAAVLEMYYLLGRSDHAVVFARNLGRSREETGDVAGALEYYFAAAREYLGPLKDHRSGRDLLQQLVQLVDRHEREIGEVARARRSILERITQLQRGAQFRGPATILADREIGQQVWLSDIEAELTRRAEEQARGGSMVLENGVWVKRLVPPPSVLMWKIRALLTLARTQAQLGDIRPALDCYRTLLDEYRFLTPHVSDEARLPASFKTEAHFMMLRHSAQTGTLVRDHEMNRLNKLNLVSDRMVFTREFPNDRPDARARVQSRHEGRAYEYYDFAAPPGHQIESVTLRATVAGIAAFRVDVPNPTGWPPRYSFSKGVADFKLATRGLHRRTADLPPGTAFVSLGTSWGPGLFANTRAEVEQWKLNPPPNGLDIARWEVAFVVSPKASAAAGKKAGAPPLGDAVRGVIGRYAAGWERASVVRDEETTTYTGTPPPRLDVYTEDWLVFALDGDIHIFQQKNPRLEVALPVTINSREREFDASLVRAHDGRYALLWARGTSKTLATRFVAFSADLLRWEPPQRLAFEEPPANTRYTYALAEPLERTYNIVPLRRGYAMLLAQGFVRLSEDLRHWGPPRKSIPQELERNRLVRGRDGMVWAVYENPSRDLQPYTAADWLRGFFVVDGKQYRHVTELGVSRSVDGIVWETAGTATLPGQPSALWTFAVDDRQIGIALSFNKLTMTWFTVSPHEPLTLVGDEHPLLLQSDEAEWFVRDAELTCVRPVFDPERQKPMLLLTSTKRGLGGPARP